MAFTIAHMAAALPFYPARRWLQFDALLIGTMMPDMPYYTGIGNPNGNFSHQWLGIFAYCLPWGLVIFALWYWGLKPAAYALVEPFLGDSVRKRHDTRYDDFNNNRYERSRYIIGYNSGNYWSLARFQRRFLTGSGLFYLSVAFGLSVGAVTHIIWDGITHDDGLIARHIQWLQYPVYFYPFKGTSIARLLQYLSSMAGLVILLWFAVLRLKNWYQRSRNLDRQVKIPNNIIKPFFTRKQSLLIVGLMIFLSTVWFIRAVLRWYPSLIGSPYNLAARVSVVVIRDMAILCIIYAALYHLLRLIQHTYQKHRKY